MSEARKLRNEIIIEGRIRSNVMSRFTKEARNSSAQADFILGHGSQMFQVTYPSTREILEELELKNNIFVSIEGVIKESLGDILIKALSIELI